MGLSLGNQVDGLPGALHTEALWGGQGVFGPAPIHALHKKEKEKVWNQRSDQVQECICVMLIVEVIF